MSTLALIAHTKPDLTIQAATCHFDGYLRGVGKTLLEHYNDPAMIRTIFAPGLRLRRVDETGPEFLDEPQEPIVMSAGSFRQYPPDLAQEYIYHHHNGLWWVLCGNRPTAKLGWQLLSQALEQKP